MLASRALLRGASARRWFAAGPCRFPTGASARRWFAAGPCRFPTPATSAHLEPEHLSYLPFHFLLASLGHSGYLKYHDVSTGAAVSEHNTRLGSARCCGQNPQTGVLDVGHANGVVTLWSPAQSAPLARVL